MKNKTEIALKYNVPYFPSLLSDYEQQLFLRTKRKFQINIIKNMYKKEQYEIIQDHFKVQ